MNSSRRCTASVANRGKWTDRLVADAGIPDPVPAARALMALGDGLMLHRLTVDPELDVRPPIERAGRALAATP